MKSLGTKNLIGFVGLSASLLVLTALSTGCKGGDNGSNPAPAPAPIATPAALLPGQNPNNPMMGALSTDIIQGKIVNRQFTLVSGFASQYVSGDSCREIYSLNKKYETQNNNERSHLAKWHNLGVIPGSIRLNFDANGVLTVMVQDLGGLKTSGPITPLANQNSADTFSANTYYLDGTTQTINIAKFYAEGPLRPEFGNALLRNGDAYKKLFEDDNDVIPSSDFPKFSMANSAGFNPNYQAGQPVIPPANQSGAYLLRSGTLTPNYSRETFDGISAQIRTLQANPQHIEKMAAVEAITSHIEVLASDVHESCSMTFNLSFQSLIFN